MAEEYDDIQLMKAIFGGGKTTRKKKPKKMDVVERPPYGKKKNK